MATTYPNQNNIKIDKPTELTFAQLGKDSMWDAYKNLNYGAFGLWLFYA